MGGYAAFETAGAFVGRHADQLLGLVSMAEGASIVLESHASVGYPGVTYLPIDAPDAQVSVSLATSRDVEDLVVGNFVAFMRDRARLAEAAPSDAASSQTPDPPP